MNYTVYRFFARLANDDHGLTAVEYAVLGAMVVAAIVVVGGNFDDNLDKAFTGLFNKTPA